MPYIEFKQTYQSWQDNRIYKAGEIVDVDHDNFLELTSIGIATESQEESRLNVLLKSIYKMNREELLLFAEEHNIKIENEWKNETLIRKIIEMNLITRGD